MAATVNRENGICIRGVSSGTAGEALKAAFSGFGSIVDVFVKDTPGRRGYAFVTFADNSSVAAALAGAPATIGEDSVTVEARTPARERKVASPCANIYIKGLGADNTEEQVQAAVGGFGNVTSLELAAERGFAFVSFDSVDEAQAAVSASPLSIGSASGEVEFRMSEPKKGGRGGGGGGGAGRKKREPRAANSIYLKGVPADAADADIEAALASFGTCTSVVHRDGRDFAFAAFDSAEECAAAIAGGSCSVGGNDVTIEERNGGK